MKIRDNKHGFTLVELLAVIVILALIMSVAVVSMGSVMDNARRSTFKDSAAAIIDGVRTQLTVANRLYDDANKGINYAAGVTIYFKKDLLDQGATESPLGGEIDYYASDNNEVPVSSINDPTSSANAEGKMIKIGNGKIFYKKGETTRTCSNTETDNAAGGVDGRVSFVTITKKNDIFEYSICLLAGKGNYYIKDAKYDALLSDDDSFIKSNGE